MKFLYIFLFALFLTGCNNHTHSNNDTNVTKLTQKSKKTTQNKKTNLIIVKDKDFNLSFENSKLIYPKKRMILLFTDKSFYSGEEKRILNKLNVRYYVTDNNFLKNYFKISIYPTIIVIESNKTVKYENFTPYEILKAEGF